MSQLKLIPDSLKDKLSDKITPYKYSKATRLTDFKDGSIDAFNFELIESAGYIVTSHKHSEKLTLILDLNIGSVYDYSSGYKLGEATCHSAALSKAIGKISRAGFDNMAAFLSRYIDKHGLANGSEFPAYYRAGCDHIESTPAELEALQAASKQLTPLAIVADYVAPRTGAMAANKPAKSNKTRIIKTDQNKVVAVITESTPEPEPIKSTTDIMRERLAKVEAKPLPSELKPAKSQANKPPQYSSEVMTQIAKQIYNLPGIKLEICGAWLWVSGNTKPHASELKAAGLRYASLKRMWYYAGTPAFTKKHLPIDAIRSKYGSKQLTESDYQTA